MMIRWLKDLDRILRGNATSLAELRRGTIEIPVGGITIVLVVLAMIYGSCMGSFSVFRGSDSALLQVIASTLKVPALFVLTLLVTFPSLYVFNALVGSRLQILAVLRLLVAGLRSRSRFSGHSARLSLSFRRARRVIRSCFS